MRKVLIAAAIAAVAALLIAPGFVARLTEQQVRARIADINAESPLLVTLESYERGWFGATANLAVRLDADRPLPAGRDALPAGFDPTMTLPVRAVLGHGPVGYNDGLFVGLSRLVARADARAPDVAALEARYAMPYLFEFRSRLGFGGALVFDADVPAGRLSDGAANVEFSPLAIEGSLEGNRLVARVELARLESSAGGRRLEIGNARAAADNRFLGNRQIAGRNSLEIETLDTGDAAIESLRLDSRADVEDGLWTVRADFAADAIRTDGERLDALELGLGVNAVDASAATRIGNALSGSAADAPVGATVLTELQGGFEALLAAGPSIDVAPLRFRMGGEPFDANLRIAARDAARPNLLQLVTAPFAWLALVDANAAATLSKPLARRLAVEVLQAQLASGSDMPQGQIAAAAETQASLMLVMIAAQGYVDESDDAYSTDIRLVDGELTINGRPMPLGLP